MGRLPWLFVGVFGLVGSGSLAAAGFTIHSALAFRDGASSAQGTVVSLDGGRPVVEFEDAEGSAHRVVGSVSSNPPAYEVGERVTVWHRPGQPERARLDGLLESWFLPSLFGFLGSVFTAIAAAFLISTLRKQRLRSWLQQFGTRVQAKYTGVMLDTSMRVNRRHPWRLTAQWQDPVTGLVHTFESDMLFWDPSDHVQRETVEVWIDANDPSRHYLDTTFLPKHAGA